MQIYLIIYLWNNDICVYDTIISDHCHIIVLEIDAVKTSINNIGAAISNIIDIFLKLHTK